MSLKETFDRGTSRLGGLVCFSVFYCSLPEQVPSDMEVFEQGLAISGAKQNVDFLKYFFSMFPCRSKI